MRRLLPLAVILTLVSLAPSPSFADAEGDRVMCFSLGNQNYKDRQTNSMPGSRPAAA